MLYANQCSVCHGVQGEGNGSVVGNGRFPLGPALSSGIAAGRTDGYIYGVIRVGRGLMPSYGDRIGNEDRWAVVHYVRQLQGQPAGGTAAAPGSQLPAATQPAAAVPAPATGTDTGAVTPAEIAVSILAELIAVRRGADTASLAMPRLKQFARRGFEQANAAVESGRGRSAPQADQEGFRVRSGRALVSGMR